MTYTDTGVRGATHQSWRGANPRDLLKRVIDDNPGADRVALFRLFVDKLQEDDDSDYMETIIEYWFANNYHSLLASQTSAASERSSAAAASERAAWLEGTKAKLAEKIGEQVTILLSEMLMPNGKQLNECTGQECAELGRRFGSWFGKIARRVKPDETVGAVLSEDDLRALYEKRA